MTFTSEKKLLKGLFKSKDFVQMLNPDALDTYFHLEPEGLFGIPDLVIVILHDTKRVRIRETLAFELKLSNWKRALIQAYKYKSFANRSFVLMDAGGVTSAVKNIALFKKAEVGLLSLDTGGVLETHYYPGHHRPYSEQLTEKYRSIVASNLNKEPGRITLERLRLKVAGYSLRGIIPL
ncbi:MAG: hypothetical protein WEC16_00025 [Anaerolineales bacterium]